MGDNKIFSVVVIGTSDHERNILKSICKLSQYRENKFVLVEIGSSCQILIVDGDDQDAINKWSMLFDETPRQLSSSLSSNLKHITIMVTKQKSVENISFYIRRPFVTTHILGVLDQAATVVSRVSQSQITSNNGLDLGAGDKPITHSALVVDDSVTIRKQVEVELKPYNIYVDEAESGEQALKLLAQKNYDIIFLDVLLPGMDGYQICRHIKKDKFLKKIPVIMLTSKSSPFDWVKGSLAGCDTYLTKPAKQESFFKVMKKFLKK